MHRALDDEDSSLHRALERAAKEANESLELATGKNAKLQDAIAEKESALDTMLRENETLKASEAAARVRAKELDSQLAISSAAPREATDGGAGGKETMDLLLQKWADGEVVQGELSAAFLDSGRVMARWKDRMFASVSNLTKLKLAAAAAAMDDYSCEFDHFDEMGQYGDSEHAVKHKKRRSILRKFGDLFRRSLYKFKLAPVLHHH